MTFVKLSLLVLLDLQDEHQHVEKIFDFHLFRRFTNKSQCLEHISSHLTNLRLLHLFLPKSEHLIIGDRLGFCNTIYYIYCINRLFM